VANAAGTLRPPQRLPESFRWFSIHPIAGNAVAKGLEFLHGLAGYAALTAAAPKALRVRRYVPIFSTAAAVMVLDAVRGLLCSRF
jgi:hypothetical protein